GVGRQRAVVEVAGEFALLALLGVDAAFGALVGHLCAFLREAAFGADAVGDVLDRIVGGRLVRHAAVPGRTGPLHDAVIGAQRARRRNVALDVELGVVLDRHAGLGIKPLGPIELVHILAALDGAAIAAIQ